jgi:pimeloyl-ACP methyl ester carboxylesterase
MMQLLDMTWIKSMLTITLILVIGSYLLICGLIYFKQERLIFFPETLAADFRFSFPAPFEEVTWQVDGASLHALHFKAEQPKGVVLYLHGNAGSLQSWGSVAAPFLAQHYDVLMPDYRGYGKSTGTIADESTLLADAGIAYSYLLQHYPDQQILIYGRSLGTGPAVYLAKEHHPRLLILETPYYSLRELASAHMPWAPRFLLKYPLRTDRWIGAVRCPIYLFHGTDDELIPYAASQRLTELIQTKHQLITIPGGTHNTLAASPLYHQRLREILDGAR